MLGWRWRLSWRFSRRMRGQFATRAAFITPPHEPTASMLCSHFGLHALNLSEKAIRPPSSAAVPETTATLVLVQPRKSHTLGSEEDAFSAARRTVSSTFISFDSCDNNEPET